MIEKTIALEKETEEILELFHIFDDRLTLNKEKLFCVRCMRKMNI
jgi:hypothetical protein